jgi:hypothetical protein
MIIWNQTGRQKEMRHQLKSGREKNKGNTKTMGNEKNKKEINIKNKSDTGKGKIVRLRK